MTANNMYFVIITTLLVFSPITWSAPDNAEATQEVKQASVQVDHRKIPVKQPMKIHIFTPKQKAAVQVSKAPVPKTPELKVHVFDTLSVQQQKNAVVSERYLTTNTQDPKQAVLTYQSSESYMAMGYQQDSLDWSIAGPNGSPNVLSEVSWDSLQLATLNMGTTLLLDSHWLINLDLMYGKIYDGDNQNSDYLGDNKTLEFSRSNTRVKGSVFDVSTAVGYRWIMPLQQDASYPHIEIRPQLGLSYFTQNFKMTDGFQTLSFGIPPELGFSNPPVGPLTGLNNSFDAEWFGPWLGVNSIWRFTDLLSLSVNLEYHYAKYDSTAYMNLRNDLARPESFSQEAKGHGLIGELSGMYQYKPQVSFVLSIKYQDWQADDQGVDKTFLFFGQTISSQLNGVNWQSLGASMGVMYHF